MTLQAVSRVHVRQRVDGDHPGDEIGLAWMVSRDTDKMTVFKLVFVSSHLIAALVRFQRSFRIAVCQTGAASWWSVHMDEWFPFSSFVDTAFHQEMLYAIDLHHRYGLFTIDISVDHSTGDPWVSQLRRVINIPCYPHSFVTGDVFLDNFGLVESCGALLMVRRWKTVPVGVRGPGVYDEFEVFEANFEQSQWTKMTTIGDDQVLFLRRRCSRSVCVSPYDMPGDRIVFLENDGEDRLWYSKESSSSCCVYNLMEARCCAWLPATWLFPKD